MKYLSAKNTIILLILLSFSVMYFFHQKGCSSELRYSVVAEGNISLAVGEIWMNPWEAYKNIIVSEAKSQGRIRPAHYIFHQIPFLITLIRNGDIITQNDGVDIAHRINGDLQTHVIVLLAFLSIAIFCLSYVLYSVTHSIGACFVFIVSFSGSLTIGENLLRNYCDSGEIYQIFSISMYVLLIFLALNSSGRARIKYEACSVLCLLFAYATKETSLVLLPVSFVLTAICLRFFRKGDGDKFRSIVLRQLCWNSFFAIVLLGIVLSVRHSGYANNYAINSSECISRIQTIIRCMQSGFNGLFLLKLSILLAFFLMTIRMVFCDDGHNFQKLFFQKYISAEIVIFCISLCFAVAFGLINLPWQYILAKYIVVTALFFSLSLAVLQVILYKLLGSNSKIFSYVFAVIMIFFFAKEAISAVGKINNYYEYEYGYIKPVPIIANDIACDAFASKYVSAMIVTGGLFYYGDLAFYRNINLIHGVNIYDGSLSIYTKRDNERNYFHIINNAPLSRIVVVDKIQSISRHEIDAVYIYDKFADDLSEKMLLDQGFLFSKKYLVDKLHSVSKYERLKDYNSNTRSRITY